MTAVGRTALLWLATLLAGCALPGGAARNLPRDATGAAPRIERVVLISIDTLRADYLGCYGSTRVRTPVLDSIAADGARFETAIAPTPITLPSHASLLTGLDPSRHGVHHNTRFRLPEEIPTLAERFAESGYSTAAFVAAVVLGRNKGLDRGFEVYDDRMQYRRTTAGWGGHGERRADRVVDSALEWLEEAPERFFLWLHLYDPHANYDPPPGYRPRRLPAPPEGGSFAERLAVLSPPLYAGEITFVDAQIGRFLGELRRRFDERDTLIVVTSDHGESLGEHGELTHTMGVYDATQRIPLLMSGPGVPPGRVVAAPVRLVDVAPTITSLAGVPPLPDTSGVDLGPWLGGLRDDPLDAYVETLATYLDFGWSPLLGIRTERFKYLRQTRPELYDLAADPGETRNLAAGQPERVAELDALLAERLEKARPPSRSEGPSPEEAAQLEALGYVVGAPERELPELGWVGGDDPRDRIDVVFHMLEARSLLQIGRWERAAALLEDVPEAGGWIAEARSAAALASGDVAAALGYAREAVATQPQRPQAQSTLAEALEANGEIEAALAAYRAAAALDPNDPEPLADAARLAEQQGDLAAAAGYYESAVAATAPSAEAALRLAALRFEQGRPSLARALLQEAWRAPGLPAELRVRVAFAEARAGYPTQALQRLDAAYRADPSSEVLSQAYAEIREQYGTIHFPAP